MLRSTTLCVRVHVELIEEQADFSSVATAAPLEVDILEIKELTVFLWWEGRNNCT